ncbi:site-specific integrase [Saccharolobus islandicus]|nr:hypothetical protein [Sulfolobus islandicus]
MIKEKSYSSLLKELKLKNYNISKPTLYRYVNDITSVPEMFFKTLIEIDIDFARCVNQNFDINSFLFMMKNDYLFKQKILDSVIKNFKDDIEKMLMKTNNNSFEVTTEHIEKFMKKYELNNSLSHKTKLDVKYFVNDILKPFIMKESYRLSKDTIINYMSFLKEKKIADFSFYFSKFKTFVNFLIYEEINNDKNWSVLVKIKEYYSKYMKDNNITKTKTKRINLQKIITDTITSLQTLLDKEKYDVFLYLLLLFETGKRSIEVSEIRSDIIESVTLRDQEAYFIHFEYIERLSKRKTKAITYSPIFQNTYNLIMTYIDTFRERIEKKHKRLFTKNIKELLYKNTEIKKLHTYRTFFNTYLKSKEVPIDIIDFLLSHKSSINVKYYTDLYNEDYMLTIYNKYVNSYIDIKKELNFKNTIFRMI